MLDFGFYSQEQRYLDPPDEHEYKPDLDEDFNYESMHEREVLEDD